MNKWCGCLLLLMFIGCGNPGGDVDIAEPNQLGEADETPFLMVPVVPNDLFPYLSVETFSGKNYPGTRYLGP
ncbi:MAG: hypothetical protein KDA66_13055 [Planctomycetaceae bacterium]|nr:hypothetical protein [Planctomycetaceae bacterium]MCB9950238.1 hypothetical protein [Planctomycetaceae bacterium]